MTLDEIKKEAYKDLHIDKEHLDTESLRSQDMYAKYLDYKTNFEFLLAKAKGLITSPPRKYSENNAIKVVKLVITVLDKVLLIEILKSSFISNFLYFLKFSLILSYTTTESLIL